MTTTRRAPQRGLSLIFALLALLAMSLGAVALKSFQKTLESDANIKATMQNAQNGEPMPSVPEMSRFWSSFETALKNVTSGRQSVDEALDTAAKRIVQ